MSAVRGSGLRGGFLAEIEALEASVQRLGEMVAGALELSVGLLSRPDEAGARRLIAWDDDVNRRRYLIEEQALLVIATQQPVAGDMRRVAGVIALAGELERVGDYAKGIASISLDLPERFDPGTLATFDVMAGEAAFMLRAVLPAFAAVDGDLARAIWRRDDLVDQQFKSLFAAVMSWPHTGHTALEQANFALWIGHNLERAADRVTNICERIVFTETGRWDLLMTRPGVAGRVPDLRPGAA